MDASNTTSEFQEDDALGGHTAVLWAGGIESVWATSLLFAVIVLFTLMWEFATEKLEHFARNHAAYEVQSAAAAGQPQQQHRPQTPSSSSPSPSHSSSPNPNSHFCLSTTATSTTGFTHTYRLAA